MHMVKAGVMEDIYAHNNHIAEHVREYLMKRNVYTINVMGAPGTGKTTSLEQLMKHMKSKIYVIEGDIESDIDTERLRKENVTAAQINTFGACHLDAPLVHNAVHTMDFREGGILTNTPWPLKRRISSSSTRQTLCHTWTSTKISS